MNSFGHVGITVSDIEQSIKFYQGAFSCALTARMVRDEPWIWGVVGSKGAKLLFAHMKFPFGLHLELIQYVEPRLPRSSLLRRLRGLWRGAPWTPGAQHFCLKTEAIGEVVAVAVAYGAYRVGDIGVIPDGPNIGAKVVYLRGPDLEIIELFEEKA